MGWKEEHGVDFEVPAFIEFLASKGVVEDQSWHNDACPRFGVSDVDPTTERAVEVVIWIDHPMKSQREFGDGQRFAVTIGPICSEAEKSVATNDLETAIEGLFTFLADYHKGAGRWAEPEDYLAELLHDFDGRRQG